MLRPRIVSWFVGRLTENVTPQRIVVDLKLSIERLDHDARAGLVVHDDMNRLQLGPGRRK
jgi:hypothetical protein